MTPLQRALGVLAACAADDAAAHAAGAGRSSRDAARHLAERQCADLVRLLVRRPTLGEVPR